MSFVRFSAGAVSFVLVAATFPLIAELLLVNVGNLLPLRRRRRLQSGADVRSLLVIIPAHNEEELVGRTASAVVHSARQSSLAVTTLVIAHNCSDRSAERARAAGAEVYEFNNQAARGKGRALELGFSLALQRDVDAVLVIDADSFVSENTIAALASCFKHGARAAQCRYELGAVDAGNESQARVGSDLQALAFRAMNVIRARGRGGWNLSCGIFGNGFAVRAEVLQAVPYQAYSLAEDLEYHLHLVVAGVQTVFVPEALIVGRSSSGSAGKAQRSRWEGGRLAVGMKSLPDLTASLAGGRYRLAEPIFDLCSLPLAFGVVFLCLIASTPISWMRVYAVISLSLVVLHVSMALVAAPAPRQTLYSLFSLPWYVLRKLALIPMILNRARTGEGWARTSARQDEASHAQ